MTSQSIAIAGLVVFLVLLAAWAVRHARRTGRAKQAVLAFVLVGLSAFWGVAAYVVAGSRP